MENVNGSMILQGILDRVNSISTVPVKTASEQSEQAAKPNDGETPLELAKMLKEAALELGDGKSENPNAYKPVNEGLESGPEKNTDPVSESHKRGEIPTNIKTAVLSFLVMPTEKTAMQGNVRKALAIGIPIAAAGGAGAGYVGGRMVGEAKDRKNNQAYYEAGIYAAAQQLARQLRAEGAGSGK